MLRSRHRSQKLISFVLEQKMALRLRLWPALLFSYTEHFRGRWGSERLGRILLRPEEKGQGLKPRPTDRAVQSLGAPGGSVRTIICELKQKRDKVAGMAR